MYFEEEATSNGPIVLTEADLQKYYPIKEDFRYLEHFGIDILSQIGRGGFGVVYRGLMYGKKVAVKINFSTISWETLFIEIGILQLSKGKNNLVQIQRVLNIQSRCHIVTEYIHHQPFSGYFVTLERQGIRSYMHKLLLALKDLKEIGVIHRDVKPANFLYNTVTKQGRLVDFGVSSVSQEFTDTFFGQSEGDLAKRQLYLRIKKCQESQGPKLGTNLYSPLEVLLRQKQSYSVDMWSAGIIFLQLLVKKYTIFKDFIPKRKGNSQTYLYSFLMQLAQLYGKQVVKVCQSFNYRLQLPFEPRIVKLDTLIDTEKYGQDAVSLLVEMLRLDPRKRIPVEAALAHPFFDML